MSSSKIKSTYIVRDGEWRRKQAGLTFTGETLSGSKKTNNPNERGRAGTYSKTPLQPEVLPHSTLPVAGDKD